MMAITKYILPFLIFMSSCSNVEDKKYDVDKNLRKNCIGVDAIACVKLLAGDFIDTATFKNVWRDTYVKTEHFGGVGDGFYPYMNFNSPLESRLYVLFNEDLDDLCSGYKCDRTMDILLRSKNKVFVKDFEKEFTNFKKHENLSRSYSEGQNSFFYSLTDKWCTSVTVIVKNDFIESLTFVRHPKRICKNYK